jgi:hypothetical protein
MQTVNTLWRVGGRRGFLLGGITAVLYLHAGCGNPITYARLPDGVGGQAGVGDILDGGGDLPADADSAGAGGAAGLGGVSGSGGGGTAGTTGAGGGSPGTGGRTGTGGSGPGSAGSMGAGGGIPGTGGLTGTGGATGVGGSVGVGGRIGSDGGTGTGGAGDLAQYNFETSTQGWGSLGAWTGVGPSSTQRFAGQSSFGGTLAYTPVTAIEGTTFELGVAFPQPPLPIAGNTVTFHVFLPASAMGLVKWIQPYIQDATLPTPKFAGAYKNSFLSYGGWDTLSVPIPAGFVSPIFKVAVQFNVSGAVPYTGTVYVDAISW